MSMTKIHKSGFTFLIVAGCVFSAWPAHAGFEWVGPNNGMSAGGGSYSSTPTPVPLSPLAGNAPDAGSPVVISGDSQNRYAPQVLTPPPSSAATVDLSQASTSAQPGADTVQGFATQVPLTLALRQILPSGYNFSIDQDVSMDTAVSYSGGRPWRETAAQMLAAAGLSGREQGNTYSVSRAQPAMVPVGSGNASDVSSMPNPMPNNASADNDIDPGTGAPMADSPLLHSSFPPPAPKYVSVGGPSVAPAPFTMASAGGAAEWSAERGETLRKVLTDWCGKANIELQWMTEYDYPIEASAHFNSSFEDAVRELLAGFGDARPQPIGELHASTTAGQKVLVVQARGNNYTN